MAVVNAVGDVLEADGSVLAGIRRGDGYVPSEDVIAAGAAIRRPWRDATTLVCVVTDVVLTKTEAWVCARAANAGVARAVSPVWTPFDGDTVFCASTCRVDGDPLAVSLLAAAVVAEAIRDGVREATAAPGCPALSGR
jgi:L-aminopeptidase/D-esterase-like protein